MFCQHKFKLVRLWKYYYCNWYNWLQWWTVLAFKFKHIFCQWKPVACIFLTPNILFYANLQQRTVVRELIETEEEFGKDLNYVVNKYINTIEKNRPPTIITNNKEVIFNNFKQIAEFHNT